MKRRDGGRDGRTKQAVIPPRDPPPGPKQELALGQPLSGDAMLWWIGGTVLVILTIAGAFYWFEAVGGFATLAGFAMGLFIYGPLRLRASLMHRKVHQIGSPLDVYRIIDALLAAADVNTPAEATKRLDAWRKSDERLAELFAALGVTTIAKALKELGVLQGRDAELNAIAEKLGVKSPAQIDGAITALQADAEVGKGRTQVERDRDKAQRGREAAEALLGLVRRALKLGDDADLAVEAERIQADAEALPGVREELRLSGVTVAERDETIRGHEATLRQVRGALHLGAEADLVVEATRIYGDANALPGVREELRLAGEKNVEHEATIRGHVTTLGKVRAALHLGDDADLVTEAEKIYVDAAALSEVRELLRVAGVTIGEHEETIRGHVETIRIAGITADEQAELVRTQGEELAILRARPPVVVNPDEVAARLAELVGKRKEPDPAQTELAGDLGRKLEQALAAVAESGQQHGRDLATIEALTAEVQRLRPIADRVGVLEGSVGQIDGERNALRTLHAAASGQLAAILKDGGNGSPHARAKHRIMSQIGEWLQQLLDWDPGEGLTNRTGVLARAKRRLDKVMNRMIVHLVVVCMLVEAEEWELLRELLETRFDKKVLPEALAGLDWKIRVWYAPDDDVLTNPPEPATTPPPKA